MSGVKLHIRRVEGMSEGRSFDIYVNGNPSHRGVTRGNAYHILRSYSSSRDGIEELNIDNNIRRDDKNNFRRYFKGEQS